jgi:hypothetical protein
VKVHVNYPTQAKNAEVAVQGLGVLKNGHSYDFDTEAEELFCALNNVQSAPETLVLGEDPVGAGSKAAGAEGEPLKAHNKGDTKKEVSG